MCTTTGLCQFEGREVDRAPKEGSGVTLLGEPHPCDAR